MEKSEFKYDVFISYSHKDKEWVTNTLLPKIERFGISVCIDYRDFVAGKPSIVNMLQAIENCKYTLLVLTQNWVASEWTLYESILSRTNDPAGIQYRTIPILLEKCNIPKFISMLTWVDFSQKDDDYSSWKMLFTSLGRDYKELQKGWFLIHPYSMPPNFTGRINERKMLSEWLNTDTEHPLFVLRALGGFGKSALTWYWMLNDIDPNDWPYVFWWSFYEGSNRFEAFMQNLLLYLGYDITNINPHKQLQTLLNELQNPGIFVVMDGFERALRAYGNLNAAYQGDDLDDEYDEMYRDSISYFANRFMHALGSYGNKIKGKVLITTRLRPSAIETHGNQLLHGCLEKELDALQENDAVEFFKKQRIRGKHNEINQICLAYGYPPLSLRLISGLIVADLEKPRDISAARKLDITDNIIQNKHHVLQQAYDTLTKTRQVLLGRIACFRSVIDYSGVKAIATNKETFDDDLRDLLTRGLVLHDFKRNCFDLHPIVRRYCYNRQTESERTSSHSLLKNYFSAVAPKENPHNIEQLQPVIELYHHTLQSGHIVQAYKLFKERLIESLYYQFGAYDSIIELLQPFVPRDGRKHKKTANLTWIFNTLANAYGLSGQPKRALNLYRRSKKGVKSLKNNVISNINLAQQQIPLGKFWNANTNLKRCITDISQESIFPEFMDNKEDEIPIIAYREFGRLAAYRGKWKNAKSSFNRASSVSNNKGYIWPYDILLSLLMRRAGEPTGFRNDFSYYEEDLANETKLNSNLICTVRDFVIANWLLGAAFLSIGFNDKAEMYLLKSLTHCRNVKLFELEADILLDYSRLLLDGKHYSEAKVITQEALMITKRCQYVLQGADINLFLAKFAIEVENDRKKAIKHSYVARKLANCGGFFTFKYKVAYDEANSLIRNLK